MNSAVLKKLNSTRHDVVCRMTLRVPLIVLVFAATAIPVELRPLDVRGLDVSFRPSDIAANILGYVPVGVVLAGLGDLPALTLAALVSTVAETAQLFMAHRFPSAIDIASNLAGTIAGLLISRRWKIHSPLIRISRRV